MIWGEGGLFCENTFENGRMALASITRTRSFSFSPPSFRRRRRRRLILLPPAT